MEKDHTDLVRFLVKEAHADVNCKDRADKTPLLIACGSDDTDLVKWLVNEGNARVNCKCSSAWFDYTPLHAAVKANNVESVRFLVSKGAYVEAKDSSGQTPLYLAVDSRWTAPEIVECLVKDGHANVNFRESLNGFTPLHAWAMVYEGKAIIGEILIIAGADLDARDKKGFTPMQRAMAYERSDAVKVLAAYKDRDRNNNGACSVM